MSIRKETPTTTLPTESAARKEIPLARGLLDYFPAALAAVAAVSKAGNDQHNPGQPLHHNRGKSSDHADCILRHLTDRGTVDTDGQRHAAKVAWRALALLQEELEAAGSPLARGARLPDATADAVCLTPPELPAREPHPVDLPHGEEPSFTSEDVLRATLVDWASKYDAIGTGVVFAGEVARGIRELLKKVRP